MTWRRALAAVTLLAGTILFPARPALAAPAITLNPASAPAGTSGTWSITVSGSGFPTGGQVSVKFDRQEFGPAFVDRTGAFSLPITPGRRQAGTYTVEALYCGGGACLLPVQAPFTSVPSMQAYDQPSLVTTEKELCGPAGPGFNWSLHVSGAFWRADGFDPNRDARTPNVVTVIFFRLTQVVARTNVTVRPDGTWRVDGWAVPAQPAAPPGTYTVRGIDRQRAEVSLPWTVPCVAPPTVTPPKPPDTPVRNPDPPRQPDPPIITDPPIVTVPPTAAAPPVIACSPCLGPSGFVTQLTGSGFPAGATVTLRWAPGLGDKVVVADAAGAFSTQMLVMPGDTLGPRQASAEVAGGGPKATTPFLVVPLTVTPSGRDIAQLVRLTQLVHR